jgi:SLT domain-containing protein
MTDMLLQYAKEYGMSAIRLDKLVNQTKQSINADAGSAAAKESQKVSQQVAGTKQVAQQTQTPCKNYPQSVQFVTEDGMQVGADDWW